MNLQLLFFGRLSEKFAALDPEVRVEGVETVDDLRRYVSAKVEDGEKSLASVMVAVNTEYVDGGHALADGDEVAFIPPVSGG